jgi:hypothetical protein
MMETDVMEVLIMDDSVMVRERLIPMISRTAKADSISCAEDATEAVDSIHKLNPEVVTPSSLKGFGRQSPQRISFDGVLFKQSFWAGSALYMN